MLSRVLSLVCGFAAGVAAAEEWKETKSAEGNFKVLMPGESAYHSKDVKTDVGKITTHFFLFETPDGAAAYVAIYADMPAEHVRQTGAQALLDNARDGAIKATKGKLEKEAPIRYGSHPGREFSFSTTQDKTDQQARWRLYLVENRLYQLGVVGEKRLPPQEAITKFFESFALLRK